MSSAPAQTIRLTGGAVFAVIDPYFGEPSLVQVQADGATPLAELQAAREAAWERPVGQCRTDALPVNAARLPYLVQLEGPDDPLLTPLLALAAQEHEQALDSGLGRFTVGTLIETELALPELTARLEGLCTLRVNQAKRYLRLASSRTWELLASQLDEAQMADALGPIHRWHYRGRDGVWVAARGRIALVEDKGDEHALYQRPALMAELQAKPAAFRLPSQALGCMLKGELVCQTLDLLQNKGLRPTPVLILQVCQAALDQRHAQSQLPMAEQAALCASAVSHQYGAGEGSPVAATTVSPHINLSR